MKNSTTLAKQELPQIYSNSFITGTQIVTAKGFKAIEDIKETDKILTHEGQYMSVVSLLKRTYTGDMVIVTSAGMELTVTPKHLVMTSQGYVKAEELIPSSVLKQLNQDEDPQDIFEKNPVDKTMWISFKGNVYELEVKEDHSCVANGFVVKCA